MPLKKLTIFLGSGLLAPLITLAATGAAAHECSASAESEIVYNSAHEYEIRFYVYHNADQANGAIKYSLHYTTADYSNNFKTFYSGIATYSLLRDGDAFIARGRTTNEIGQVHYIEIVEAECLTHYH